jgi:hypothetical protein
MTTYGVDYRTGANRPGKIPTVIGAASVPPSVFDSVSWSPTLVDVPGSNNALSRSGLPVIYFNGMTNADDAISKVMRKGGRMGAIMREYLAQSLNGSASTVFPSYKRVQAVSGANGANLGGARVIETLQPTNHAYTAAENTALYNIFRRTSHPGAYNQTTAGYVKDASGIVVGSSGRW